MDLLSSHDRILKDIDTLEKSRYSNLILKPGNISTFTINTSFMEDINLSTLVDNFSANADVVEKWSSNDTDSEIGCIIMEFTNPLFFVKFSPGAKKKKQKGPIFNSALLQSPPVAVEGGILKKKATKTKTTKNEPVSVNPLSLVDILENKRDKKKYKKKYKKGVRKEYNKGVFFNCIEFKFICDTSTNINAKLFPNGNIQMVGLRNKNAVLNAPSMLLNFINKYNTTTNSAFVLTRTNLSMIFFHFQIRVRLDCERVKDFINSLVTKKETERVWAYATNNMTTTVSAIFLPSYIRNITLTNFKDATGEITILIRETGKVTITGGKTMEGIHEAYTEIMEILVKNIASLQAIEDDESEDDETVYPYRRNLSKFMLDFSRI